MVNKKDSILITKADGEKEMFSYEKLASSLMRAGADKGVSKEIAEEISSTLIEGITTEQIYRTAFALLKEREKQPAAAMYSLKRAVLDLGPSGFPFEDFVSEIYRAKDYKVLTGTMIEGKCAEHEVDLLAHSDNHVFTAEAKFHNRLGFKTDLKVALYVHARTDDIKNNREQHEKIYQIDDGYLITNTGFTSSAKRYAKCVGLKLVGWNYPENGGLQDLISETALHPITCLTTLSDEEKRKLMDGKNVLCRSITDGHELLLEQGISPKRAENIMKEASVLCQAGTGV
ncbi:MAG: ATPase [Parcubacteria group bacterium]|nr:ATPase [Parcubacteria group bacterium]